jgi:S1-C subfamily serine protease
MAMGGPLMDLKGLAIGVNIARSDRVTTFALPSSLVKEIADKLKSQNLGNH